MDPFSKIHLSALSLIIIGSAVAGLISIYRTRRKDRKWVLGQRDMFDKLLAETEALAANPDAAPVTDLTEIKRMLDAFAKDIDADRRRAWAYKQRAIGLLDSLQSKTKQIEGRIRRVVSARENSPRLLVELDRAIEERRRQTLSFQQNLNLRIAQAYYDNARAITKQEPVDWLLLQQNLVAGRVCCNDSAFEPAMIF